MLGNILVEHLADPLMVDSINLITTAEMLAGDLRKNINLQPPATDMHYFFAYLLVMMEACPMFVIFVVGTIQKPPDTHWLEQK